MEGLGCQRLVTREQLTRRRIQRGEKSSRATGLCLLSTNAGVGVGDLDTKSLGLLEDVDALLGRDVVGDLGSVDTVVHEEELDVTDVGDHKAAVAVGHQVTGLLVGTVTDLGHAHSAAESAADGAVDTLGLAPRLADTVVSVRVVALERLGALLDDGDGGGSHLDNLIKARNGVMEKRSRSRSSQQQFVCYAARKCVDVFRYLCRQVVRCRMAEMLVRV